MNIEMYNFIIEGSFHVITYLFFAFIGFLYGRKVGKEDKKYKWLDDIK